MQKTLPNDNAFPDESGYGLSKREYFAAAAMQGLMASDNKYTDSTVAYHVAEQALRAADALIKALNE